MPKQHSVLQARSQNKQPSSWNAFIAYLTTIYFLAGLWRGFGGGGPKPGDLSFEQPTRFRFVINQRTTNALGLTIPQSLLVSADEVIQ
jgi:hypothetical protein